MRLIVSTMKDEGPFILEWVAHYLLLGFDHFLINTNDCSDGTDKIIKRLEALGVATHIDNPGPWKKGPQASAYDNAMAHPVYRKADWVLVCDADEFLDIKVGDNTLDALFATCPKATVFAFPWLLFGHNGQVTFRDALITEQFTMSAAPQQISPQQTRGYKSLYRNNGVYRSISTHRPKRLHPNRVSEAHWVDGNGDRFLGFEHQGWAFWQTGQGFGDRIARMNHYAVRSIESYLMKRMRGDVNTTSFHEKMEASGAAYWRLHCWNVTSNTGLASRVPRIKAELDRLLQDKGLSDLHNAAVAFHQMQIKGIRATDMAQAFVTEFADYTHGQVHLLKDNVISDPNRSAGTKDFDAATFLQHMQFTRYNELKTKRAVRQWPWYMNLDALETPADVDAVKEFLRGRKDGATGRRSFPAIPQALKDDISKAVVARQARNEKPNSTEAFLHRISAQDHARWLVLGGQNLEVIDALLALPGLETAYIIDPWGFRAAEASLDVIKPDPKRTKADAAFFGFVTAYQSEIKTGRLRIIRAAALDALKLFEDEFFDACFIQGTRPRKRVLRILLTLEEKLRAKGLLALNGCHSENPKGQEMIGAVRDFISDQSNHLKVSGEAEPFFVAKMGVYAKVWET